MFKSSFLSKVRRTRGRQIGNLPVWKYSRIFENTVANLDEYPSDAVFSLVPANKSACSIVTENSKRATRLKNEYGTEVVGLYFCFPHTLSIGSPDGCDIKISPRTGRGVHYIFTTKPSNGVILLTDRSKQRRRFNDKRQIELYYSSTVILPGINQTLNFGGRDKLRFRFQIIWHDPKRYFQNLLGREVSVTRASPSTAPPMSAKPMSYHNSAGRYRHDISLSDTSYSKLNSLGRGAYGEVWRVVNMLDGNLAALKIIKLEQSVADSATEKQTKLYKTETYKTKIAKARKEAFRMRGLNHPNLVACIGHRKKDLCYEIYMDLKDGPANTLAAKYYQTHSLIQRIAADLFRDMLGALVYLSDKSLIHYDIRPYNILFERDAGSKSNYRFLLGDFGLMVEEKDPHPLSICYLYYAPERRRGSKYKISTKTDIWSLFITLAHMFRPQEVLPISDKIHEIEKQLSAAQDQPYLRAWNDMVMLDPDERPTARDLLYRFASKTKDGGAFDDVSAERSAALLKPSRKDSLQTGTEGQNSAIIPGASVWGEATGSYTPNKPALRPERFESNRGPVLAKRGKDQTSRQRPPTSKQYQIHGKPELSKGGTRKTSAARDPRHFTIHRGVAAEVEASKGNLVQISKSQTSGSSQYPPLRGGPFPIRRKPVPGLASSTASQVPTQLRKNTNYSRLYPRFQE